MKRLALPSALALLFATLLPAAQAQTVWRCGDGGRSYSETPCPGGQRVKTDDARTAAQTQSAHEAIQRDQALGSRLRKERLENEQLNRAANAAAASLGPSRASAQPADKFRQKPKAQASRQHPKAVPADDGTWRAAAVPSRPRKD